MPFCVSDELNLTQRLLLNDPSMVQLSSDNRMTFSFQAEQLDAEETGKVAAVEQLRVESELYARPAAKPAYRPQERKSLGTDSFV